MKERNPNPGTSPSHLTKQTAKILPRNNPASVGHSAACTSLSSTYGKERPCSPPFWLRAVVYASCHGRDVTAFGSADAVLRDQGSAQAVAAAAGV